MDLKQYPHTRLIHGLLDEGTPLAVAEYLFPGH